MAGASSSREVIRHLNTLFHCGTVGLLSDAELLEQFIASRDQGAEAAFAALVERHGAMVLGVCRRVLGNWHEAEDAFQATFLVLARKAKAVGRREQLANWLYGVARHTALDARARAARRQAKEKRLTTMLPTEQPERTDRSELRAILDDELARLPERTRAALILCELEGLTRRQAAGRLGISEGTLSSRLARGKEQLRDRLTRRGVALSTAALTTALSGEAHAVLVSPALVDSTIKVATLVAAGSSLTGIVSTSVATLTQGVLKAMLLAKLKLIVLGFASVALVTTGVGVVAQVPAPANHPPDQDRLKAMERKLDRLLQVLGGNEATATIPPPTTNFVPVAPPVAAGALAPMPTTAPGPEAALDLVPPPSARGLAMASSYAASPKPAQPTPGGDPAYWFKRSDGTLIPVQNPNSSQSLDGRVAALEQRLGQIERRLSEMERRLNQTHSGIDRRNGPDGRPVGSLSRGGSARSDVSADRSPFEDQNPQASVDGSPFRTHGGVGRVSPSASTKSDDAVPSTVATSGAASEVPSDPELAPQPRRSPKAETAPR